MRTEDAIKKQQSLVSAAKTAERELTAEEQTEFDALQKEIDEATETAEPETVEPTVEEPTPTEPAEDTSAQATETERQRSLEITNLCRDFKMDSANFIKEGKSVDEVRAAILEKQKQNQAPVSTRGTGEVSVTADEQDKFVRAAADGLAMRGGVNLGNTADGANEFRSMSLRDMAIMSMVRTGESADSLMRMSNDDLFNKVCSRDYYNPTAAFPSILDTAINKSYVAGYENAPATFDMWTKAGTLSDFKTHDNNYLAGPAGDFLEVPEGGEIKHDTPTDEKMPTRKLKTFGRQFTMTRQAFINDDIGFLTSIPSRYAAAAKKTQNEQVYKILFDNATIYDGKTLFHADHKNTLTTGTGATKEAIQKMILALQTQKDSFGRSIIIRPKYFVCPVGMGMDFYTIFNSPAIQTADNTQAANPLYNYRSNIQVIEDATLNALADTNACPWFLVADPTDAASIEVDYLNGNKIPQIRRMETPGTLGFVWDIYLDWGISAMDYRGILRNPGTVIADPLA